MLLTTRNIFIDNLAISNLLLATIAMPLTLMDLITKFWSLSPNMVSKHNLNRLSKVFEGEEMARNDVPDIGCIKGEGDDVKQLKNGAPAKSVRVGTINKTNNAYSAVLKSKEFSTNEKPDITSSIKRSVSTNGRAGGTETRKIGGSYYPVRLPGNLGR